MKPKTGPAFYRSQAEELRTIAARDGVPEHIKEELVKIAVEYERLAASVERRGGGPPGAQADLNDC